MQLRRMLATGGLCALLLLLPGCKKEESGNYDTAVTTTGVSDVSGTDTGDVETTTVPKTDTKTDTKEKPVNSDKGKPTRQ